MRRFTAALLALCVVVGTLAVPAAAAVTGDRVTDETVPEPTSAGTDHGADDNESVEPGAQFAGVVSVEGAEIENEVSERSFGLAIARAANDGARAAVIAERLNQTDRDLADLRERRETLRERVQNGSISREQYRAEIAELAVRADGVERIANRGANASERLPADVLRERGIDVDAIRRLAADAADLEGGEVAGIAREIAGPMDREDRPGEGRDRGRNADEGRTGTDASENETDGTENTDGTPTPEPTPRPRDGSGNGDGDGNGDGRDGDSRTATDDGY